MLSDDWLLDPTSPNPTGLRDYLWYNERMSLRKRYLLLSAIGRVVSPLMSEFGCVRAITACEEYAVGSIGLDEFDELCDKANDAREAAVNTLASAEAAHAFVTFLSDVGKLHECVAAAECAFGYVAAVRAGDLGSDEIIPAWQALERYESFRVGCAAADQEFGAYCRDVFGPNPFALPAFALVWRTGDVVGLARGIDEDRAFERLPLLADALMDAGCDTEIILTHCRSDGPHVRGCWVVDLILEKQ